MSQALTRTVCLKLDVGAADPVLAATQGAFNEAASWIASVCWEEGFTSTNTAHHRVYGETRFRFGLGAQLACCARAKAVEAAKAAAAKGKGRCPVFGPRGSIRYDAQTYRLLPRDRVSLNTLSGRVICRLVPGHRQHTLLADPARRIGGAELVRRDGTYFLHVTQGKEAPPTACDGGILGVNLGMVSLAVTSEGHSFGGGKVKGVRHYYAQRRACLQRVGTKSAKRRLKQIKRRESRFQRQTNHAISRNLVAKAAAAAKAIALEDLTGIRERTTARAVQRAARLSWAFSQLRIYITYKATAVGVPVLLVDPRNTSRTCSACGHCAKANRQSQASFLCRRCGFTLNADRNAAIILAQRAAANRPMVSATSLGLPVVWSQDVEPGTSRLL